MWLKEPTCYDIILDVCCHNERDLVMKNKGYVDNFKKVMNVVQNIKIKI